MAMGVLVLDAPVRGAPAGKFAGLIGGDPLWSKVKKCAESTLQWQSAIIGLSLGVRLWSGRCRCD